MVALHRWICRGTASMPKWVSNPKAPGSKIQATRFRRKDKPPDGSPTRVFNYLTLFVSFLPFPTHFRSRLPVLQVLLKIFSSPLVPVLPIVEPVAAVAAGRTISASSSFRDLRDDGAANGCRAGARHGESR